MSEIGKDYIKSNKGTYDILLRC